MQENSPRVDVFDSSGDASHAVAAEVAELIESRSAAGRPVVLGLATGSTPKAVYAELVRRHREEGLSFAGVTVFNLDEYWPMAREARQSFRHYLRRHLLDHIDVDPSRVCLCQGDIPLERVADWCRDYEKRIREAGGIDLQILGIGRTGHIGFNEPGSTRTSRTRIITLDRATRVDAASEFFGEWNVPRSAITMGVETILEARRIVLLAFGEHKADIVRRALEEPIRDDLVASFLREHPNVTFALDRQAAERLTRFLTPWRLGPLAHAGLEWDRDTTARAVVWLARETDKPILKLTDDDYKDHDLAELLAARGSAYELNIEVFKRLQRTITGWPGGKPDRSEDSSAPASSGATDAKESYPKRVLVFSPHPDDDVISMGGTLLRLCDQGHEVHVAYQTSGNIAVFDTDVERHVDFFRECAAAFDIDGGRADTLAQGVTESLAAKEPGQVDDETVRRLKGLIRRTEARAAAIHSGVRPERVWFLDLPFYETGRIAKSPISEEDVAILVDLLERIQPHQVYAAGDLADPHGTHRVCLDAIHSALERVDDRPWMQDCEVWLYRGAWQEWEPYEIEMAVPLSPAEVARKRMAIFKHESQKDRALFPGTDPREFWQRAEARNRATAEVFDRLGLPEYQAIEGFVRARR